MKESYFQRKIKLYLEGKGAVVLKTSPGVLNPTGIPDLLILYKGKWAMLEVKPSLTAKSQPLQAVQLARFKDMNLGLVYKVYPENWDRVQELLNEHLFYKNAA